jgi:cytochrome c oxidase cbb3-type subunit 3
MNSFWSNWITFISLGNVFACLWLIWWAARPRKGDSAEGEVTGHVWDGLEEYNNPMPRWWLWLFYCTIAFALIYYALYPGLGNYKGLLGWTKLSQYNAEVDKADAKYGPLFKQYAEQDLASLAKDEKALAMGGRIFSNYCAICHSSDAGGGPGFPNLTDNDWLWGGSPEQIEATIMNGRTAMMPAHKQILGGTEQVRQVAQYVISLSGRDHDAQLAVKGKEHFDKICVACHMPNAQGNPALGAPNLTDKTWLYGSAIGTIEKTISDGRNGVMPAHKDFLGSDKAHLVAAYVYSLSQK